MRHVRNISILWQTQIRSSSWSYSYSLSLCPEPLLFLKKKKITEREKKRERDREKLQQPVPPCCRWRQALGYCCFSFKKHCIQDRKYIRAQPMQFMLNAPISAYGIYYVDIMHYQSHPRGGCYWEQRAKKTKKKTQAAGDWEINTYCKNLSSPGLYAMACWSSFISTSHVA